MSELNPDDTQTGQSTRRQPRLELAKAGEPEQAAPPRRERRRSPFGYMLLWLICVSSLLINIVMLRQVLIFRDVARRAVDDAVEVVASLQQQTLNYVVVVNQVLPVDTYTPVNETIPIVVDQELEIDTTVTVPVNAGLLGTFDVDIPIRATIPVYFEQDVRINQPFHIQAAIPINFEIPIRIAVADTGLYNTLETVKQRLMALSQGLGAPLITLIQPR